MHIISTNGIPISIDAKDISIAEQHTWTVDTEGYAKKYFEQWRNGKRVKRWVKYLHREIMGNPKGTVDHINKDRLDNRRANLRIASKSLNALNSNKVRNKLGARGVYSTPNGRKPYGAKIIFNKKVEYLGAFDTIEEASQVYLKRQEELTR